MPVIVPNFIALGQTMYEKSVTIFYTLQYFGTSGGPLGPKIIYLGGDVQQGISINLPNFVPF